MFEPGRQRLQLAEIAPLHFSLVTEQDSISENKKKKKNNLAWRKKTGALYVLDNSRLLLCLG